VAFVPAAIIRIVGCSPAWYHTVNIPASDEERAMTAHASERQAIVIVEDDPDVLNVLQRLLRFDYPGYDVITAANGNEALDCIGGRETPLLITDYTMPEMNGLELTARVKAANPATVVVLITAYVTPEVERSARQAGVDHFLPKPFRLDQVEAIVRQALGG
jgi:CheY-like chemotaxis protein